VSDIGKFPIVGVGASAGGIEALEGFFLGLPLSPGVALVVLTHLSPERESLLHEIIGRYTKLPVHVAADNVLVELNNIYVLPADATLSIENRRLLIGRNTSRRERHPIDVFFSSLANDVGELAAGIVLSGGDSDGTLGIKAIKEHGGLTFAQVGDGFGPRHPDMPNAAIATGLVDFAIPVEEMGQRLIDFARGVAVLENITASIPFAEDQTIDQAMPEIYGILRTQIGHDFSGYKTKTFMRRVQRRMQVIQLLTMDGYIERLRRDPQEVGALFRDLLINVTTFFRDAEAFEHLAKFVVPKLFENRGADNVVRVWVPGCSTGEEVFSIGILLREHMDQLTAVPRVQIFATDIDERSLGVARAARYPVGLLDNVSPERRSRFFIPDGASFVVSKEVREFCIFSPHSVIRDPPFSRIDLISCRNLLIYFGPAAQNQVIPTFHYALRPDGHLFLGSAENASQFEDLFVPVDKKHRIFRRRSDVSSRPRVPLLVRAIQPVDRGGPIPRRTTPDGITLRQRVGSQVLEHFSPPHVVVNRDGDLVYFSTRTGKYFEAPPGAPTRQLMTTARRGLRLDLRTVFKEAVETGRAVVRHDVSLDGDNGGVQMVTITIEPLNEQGDGEPLYLVLFSDHGPVLTEREASDRVVQGVADRTGLELERELRETRDRLQSLIEEYETALEELKSSNEELVSVNEEMQSTNEELEASKEELQSVNEELHTVNFELSGKIEALDLANSDLQNLFESTDIATVFLDKNMVIRSFTPSVATIFNILPSDRGRPITDLSSRLDLASFSQDIAAVCADHRTIEHHVENVDHTAHYLARIAPYRNGNHRTDGVVVTFVDITNLVRADSRQRVLIAELQHRTRNLLGIVQSVAQQTLGKGGSLEAFSIRLSALGRVQGLLGGAMDDHIDLGDIVRLELEAVGAPTEGKVIISGPPVSLGFELIQTFGLALHELATNAAKYGALKEERGHLQIEWSVGQDWRESGVGVIAETSRKGFGLELIKRALPFTLRAKVEHSFGADGVFCHIELPLTPRRSSNESNH
jgi:two-component system, chemotaxis family, CheB/CheR fusion protein